MAGQFKTRRNPDTGRLEKVPVEEQAELQQEAARQVPLADPQEARDAEFMEQAKGGMEPPGEAPAQLDEPQEETGVEEVAEGVGAKAGGAAFGPVGAAVGGAAAAFITQKLMAGANRPIGAPASGGTVQGQEGRDIADLLAVTQEIARAGTPIRDAITTTAAGSRL